MLAAAPTVPRLRKRCRDLVGRHRALLGLVTAAGLLRLLVMLAYQPAFWYDGDSGAYLSLAAHPLRVNPGTALGYVVFLKVLRHTGTLFSVVALQHLLGLLMAVAVYALLLRRGVRRWLAGVLVVPLLFDGFVLTIEHYVLVETVYTSLLLAAVVALLWWPRPSTRSCLLAGLLLAAAWFVKPLALPFVLGLLGYLAIRRVGWRGCGAFALAFVIPYAGVVLWVGGQTSPYGANNLAWYGRVAGFANCEQLTLTDAERSICPAPDIRGHRPDWYAWVEASPGFAYRSDRAADPLLRQFAIDVVRQQPLDYLRAIGKETAAHFVDGVDPGPDFGCLDGRYTMARTSRVDGPRVSQCHPELASGGFRSPKKDPHEDPGPNLLTRALARYSATVRTPHLATTGVYLLVGLAGLVYLRRRRGRFVPGPQLCGLAGNKHLDRLGRVYDGRPSDGRDAGALVRDASALAGLSLTIIVLPVLVGMYEPRYALPALPFLALAAGLAGRSFSAHRRDAAVISVAPVSPVAALAPAPVVGAPVHRSDPHRSGRRGPNPAYVGRANHGEPLPTAASSTSDEGHPDDRRRGRHG